ncbi:hypothetical protein NMY22_g19794 [Coprinellus aureogranulatus]|nr:hypothetical protein NMY22_g19794 [Coprinellus aureogranulatus]
MHYLLPAPHRFIALSSHAGNRNQAPSARIPDKQQDGSSERLEHRHGIHIQALSDRAVNVVTRYCDTAPLVGFRGGLRCSLRIFHGFAWDPNPLDQPSNYGADDRVPRVRRLQAQEGAPRPRSRNPPHQSLKSRQESKTCSPNTIADYHRWRHGQTTDSDFRVAICRALDGVLFPHSVRLWGGVVFQAVPPGRERDHGRYPTGVGGRSYFAGSRFNLRNRVPQHRTVEGGLAKKQ